MNVFLNLMGPVAGLIGSGCGMYVTNTILKGMTPATSRKAQKPRGR